MTHLVTPSPLSNLTQPSISVVGGGAAGFFSALCIAEEAKRVGVSVDITIYEAGAKPLQKVFISGGGRCNVTHHCYDPKNW